MGKYLDGGLTFTKKGWPHNQIIQPTGANTTATAARGQQVGEGDHSLVVSGDWLFLFFYEWDASPTGFGLARSAVADGGVPGTWKKYLCTSKDGCGFTSDGLGGDSSALSGITGPTVTWRAKAGGNSGNSGNGGNIGNSGCGGEFIAIGTRNGGLKWQDPEMVGCGPRLSFARPANGEPPVKFEPESEPLIFADSESWARSNSSRELYAYSSIVVSGDSSTLWWYFTYLQPGASFHQRYFVRRRIDTDHTSTIKASRVSLTLRQGKARPSGRGGDWWASTAVVPSSAAFAFVARVGTVLVTGGANRVKLIDCYISQWDDHMLAHESECNAALHRGVVNLRTLGFVFDDAGAAQAKKAGLATQPIFRCFDNATKNHAVSLEASCNGRGKMEFALGHVVPAPTAPVHRAGFKPQKSDDEDEGSVPPSFFPHSKPTNIVFMLSDDLGFGDVSIATGVEAPYRIPTPNIQRIADAGMVFRRAYSGQVCAPSRYMLMLGQHSGHCTIRGNDGSYCPLLPTDTTVAAALNGTHTTALFGKWGLGNYGSSGYPLSQGFGTFVGQDAQGACHDWYPLTIQNGTNDRAVLNTKNETHNGTVCLGPKPASTCTWMNDHDVDEAVAFIQSHASETRPFFMYLATTTPHIGHLGSSVPGTSGGKYPTPLVYREKLPKSWTTMEAKDHIDAQFGSAVIAQDDIVGKVLDAINATGIEKRTVVFFSGDNGPDDHNFANFGDPGPFRGKKRSLHEGGIR